MEWRWPLADSTPRKERPPFDALGLGERDQDSTRTEETAMNRFTTTMMISALGLGSQLANAAPPQDPPTEIVRFADLDLTHSQGVTVLYQRLKTAAETVCASQTAAILGARCATRLAGRAPLAWL